MLSVCADLAGAFGFLSHFHGVIPLLPVKELALL